MNIKRKLAAGALAVGLVAGVGATVASPAHATREYMQTFSGYTTKSRCVSEMYAAFNRLAASGATRTGYVACNYRNSTLKWTFAVWYVYV
ncbi:hypothetical protein [Agromyces sp. Marseille-Q5079]|uniref:hypothetical protein n=1 Tax=Agromyces sp. Marseille-Q5079 TaxID=3439059 RepID=UPI003D9C8AEE